MEECEHIVREVSDHIVHDRELIACLVECRECRTESSHRTRIGSTEIRRVLARDRPCCFLCITDIVRESCRRSLLDSARCRDSLTIREECHDDHTDEDETRAHREIILFFSYRVLHVLGYFFSRYQ